MAGLLGAMRGAILLDIPSLVRFRDGQDVFRRGLTVLVLVALLVGGVAFVVDFIGSLVTSPEAELAQLNQSFERSLQFMPPEAAQAFQEQFLANFQAGAEIGRAVDALPTRLPKVVGSFFRAFSVWAGRPLAMLGGFLAYGIGVMLAAKLLGGTGRLQEFLGTAALSAIPYLLLILEKVPCLGSVLGLVAWLWSTVIWIAATAVAHGWATPVAAAEGAPAGYRVQWGRATLAVVLPVLALAVLALVGLLGLGGLIAALSRGS
jgi:hypothetical protein